MKSWQHAGQEVHCWHLVLWVLLARSAVHFHFSEAREITSLGHFSRLPCTGRFSIKPTCMIEATYPAWEWYDVIKWPHTTREHCESYPHCLSIDHVFAYIMFQMSDLGNRLYFQCLILWHFRLLQLIYSATKLKHVHVIAGCKWYF